MDTVWAGEYVQSGIRLSGSYGDPRAQFMLLVLFCVWEDAKNLDPLDFFLRYHQLSKGPAFPKHRAPNPVSHPEFFTGYCPSVTAVVNDLILVKLDGGQHSLLYSEKDNLLNSRYCI